MPRRRRPAGQGAVAVFNESGGLEKTLVSVPLAAPWGVVSSSSFGKFGGDLLVGNFSYVPRSEIHAFHPKTHTFEGTIEIDAAQAARRAAFGP